MGKKNRLIAIMEDKLRAFFKKNFSDDVLSEENFRDQTAYYIKPEKLFDICQVLQNDSELDMNFLADITSVDWLDHESEKDGRFEVSYNLYSLSNKFRFFIKVRLDAENPSLASITDLWAGANWMEREVFDMMGIIFEGHPNLTKILTVEDLDGHPLRRDFPLTWEQPKFTWNQDDAPEVIK